MFNVTLKTLEQRERRYMSQAWGAKLNSFRPIAYTHKLHKLYSMHIYIYILVYTHSPFIASYIIGLYISIVYRVHFYDNRPSINRLRYVIRQ